MPLDRLQSNVTKQVKPCRFLVWAIRLPGMSIAQGAWRQCNTCATVLLTTVLLICCVGLHQSNHFSPDIGSAHHSSLAAIHVQASVVTNPFLRVILRTYYQIIPVTVLYDTVFFHHILVCCSPRSMYLPIHVYLIVPLLSFYQRRQSTSVCK